MHEFTSGLENSQNEDIDLIIVTMQFQAVTAEPLLAVLSKYVVLTRMEPGCRNVDLCASVADPGRYLLIEKWTSVAAQRAHFEGPGMAEMAKSCAGLLAAPPAIALWDGVSAHDLR